MEKKDKILNQIKGGLIVSCQALEEEPLHSSYIMSRMAFAAKEGGARGIRANTPEDIKEIKKVVDLPIIALYKRVYMDSSVYITPTEKEIESLLVVEPDIIALDATKRLRPGGVTLDEFFKPIRKKYKEQLFMADCATFEEGIHAEQLGFDLIGTTLSGYTEDTKEVKLPNYELIQKLAAKLTIPLIAEGGIWELQDLKKIVNEEVFAVVIGSAITRPREITKRYMSVMK